MSHVSTQAQANRDLEEALQALERLRVTHAELLTRLDVVALLRPHAALETRKS